MKTKTTTFTCSVCHETKTNTDDFTTGYGVNSNGEKVCFSCCGKMDYDTMTKENRITLYLNTPKDSVWYLTNWPGTMKIDIRQHKEGRHNITGKRYDVWFSFAGKKWHGVQYGDNTQLCHCKAVA